MKKLSKKLKEELYEKFEVRSYEKAENILEIVELGENFKRVCSNLDLDAHIVEEYLKKYVLHLILEESTNFSESELQLIRSYSGEPLLNTTIGELFEEIQDEIYFVQSNKFQDYQYSSLKKDNKAFSEGKTYHLNKASQLLNNLIFPFSERKETFYLFYYNRYVDRQGVIKPRIEKNYDKESLAQSLIDHYHNFATLLNNYEDAVNIRVNPTRDILQLERETDIYFLLKLYTLLPKDKSNKFKYRKDKKEREIFLRVIASFAVIEDIRLKLYLTEQCIQKEDISYFIKGKGYVNLFTLIYIYIPLIKEAFLDQIKAKKGVLSVKNDEIYLKEEISELKKVKNKLYLYKTTRGNVGYKLTDIKNEAVPQKNGNVIYSEDFIVFYKEVKKMNDNRQKFSEITMNNLSDIIEKQPTLIEGYLYNIGQKLVSLEKNKEKKEFEKNLLDADKYNFDSDYVQKVYEEISQNEIYFIKK
ncbi:hypothetical protein AB3Z07_26130 [Metabacillus halosaccharovorans]|uniref:hypothetical protein n=1 Tax=Metabacillus halosaccharovorans TaxID=930124 RepID=UPI0034CD744A